MRPPENQAQEDFNLKELMLREELLDSAKYKQELTMKSILELDGMSNEYGIAKVKERIFP